MYEEWVSKGKIFPWNNFSIQNTVPVGKEKKKPKNKAHILNITKETSFDVTCTKQTTFKLKIGADRLQNIQTMKTMVLNTVSVGVSIFKPPGEKFKLTYNYLLKRTNSLKHTQI